MKYRGRTITRKVLSNGEVRWQVGLWRYDKKDERHKSTRRFKSVKDAQRFIDENPARIRRYTKISDAQYIDAITKSRSIAGALRLLGVVPEGGNYRVVHRVIQRLEIDTSHMKGQKWSRGTAQPARRRPIEDYLSNRRPINSYRLKNRLLIEGYFEHKCYRCNLVEWMGMPIPIELDHINGDHMDNRLENLTILCHNCHAQTPTYRGKNKGRGSYTLDSAA